jgi:hypothetical protein
MAMHIGKMPGDKQKEPQGHPMFGNRQGRTRKTTSYPREHHALVGPDRAGFWVGGNNTRGGAGKCRRAQAPAAPGSLSFVHLLFSAWTDGRICLYDCGADGCSW